MAQRDWPPCYRFDEVDRAPSSPGLYAWYYQVAIDVATIDILAEEFATQPLTTRKDRVEAFLREQVFKPYIEAPYDVRISGKLKPEYEGRISHKHDLSTKAVDHFADQPRALLELRDLLLRSVPVFASPIYIGVAKTSLRQRLGRHRALIESYAESGGTTLRDLDDPAHSFAYEAVVERKLDPIRLFVYVQPLEGAKATAVASEYLLNRINYPLCGRN